MVQMLSKLFQPETRNEKPETKFTRRALALGFPASAALVAQSQTAPIPQNPDEELKAAKESLHRAQEQLDKFNLPMSTEPAVHFRA